MKTTRLHYLVMAALSAAALLPVSAQAWGGHGGGFGGHAGGSGGTGGVSGHGFFHFHRRFFVGFDFVGFGFPYWWYPDYYNYGYYGDPYTDSDDSEAYDYRY